MALRQEHCFWEYLPSPRCKKHWLCRWANQPTASAKKRCLLRGECRMNPFPGAASLAADKEGCWSVQILKWWKKGGSRATPAWSLLGGPSRGSVTLGWVRDACRAPLNHTAGTCTSVTGKKYREKEGVQFSANSLKNPTLRYVRRQEPVQGFFPLFLYGVITPSKLHTL